MKNRLFVIDMFIHLVKFQFNIDAYYEPDFFLVTQLNYY